jgi:hypothetical protein
VVDPLPVVQGSISEVVFPAPLPCCADSVAKKTQLLRRLGAILGRDASISAEALERELCGIGWVLGDVHPPLQPSDVKAYLAGEVNDLLRTMN